MINSQKHFKSTIISSDDRHDGQKLLKGCLGVLEDLNSLFEKYMRRASTNNRISLMGVKVGGEDIISLQQKLIFNTSLLHDFVQRFVCILPPHSMDVDISILVVTVFKSERS